MANAVKRPRMAYGSHAERVALIGTGTIWTIRQRGKGEIPHKYPSDRCTVVRLDSIEGVPIAEWRVVYCYEGRTSSSNASVHSFLTGFRREDEEMNKPVKRAPGETDLNRVITRLHYRVVQIENYLKQLGYKRDLAAEEENA